jgi:hypothetical protein
MKIKPAVPLCIIVFLQSDEKSHPTDYCTDYIIPCRNNRDTGFLDQEHAAHKKGADA